MPDSDRVTEHYVNKVRAGMILPELKNMPESYSTFAYTNQPARVAPAGEVITQYTVLL